ncbi:MAG: radical SAM protein [Candidatus Margulisiibacteriota bacterium]
MNVSLAKAIRRASFILANQRANVVSDDQGFRRGTIGLDIDQQVSGPVWDSTKRDQLLSLREVQPKDIEGALTEFLSGRHSFAASFKNAGVSVTDDFLRVLLVAPYSGEQLTNLDSIVPQKGIERIAYYLLRSLHNADALVYNPNLAGIREVQYNPIMQHFDVIGFGTLDPVFSQTIRVILDFRKRYPNSLMVLGGIAATHMNPRAIFSSLPVDIIVRGPGEIPMSRIIQHFRQEGSLAQRFGSIDGLALNDKGIPYITAPSHSIESVELDHFRMVARGDFFDVPMGGPPDRLHGRNYWIRTETHLSSSTKMSNEIGDRPMRLGTSDYCRRTCIFCSAAADKDSSSKRVELPPEDIVKLMKEARDRHPETDSFIFDDDDFITSKRRLMKLCELMVLEGLDAFPKLCKSRIDKVDKLLLAAMKRAGFRMISFGVETFSERVLKHFNKGLKLPRIEQALDWTIESGISPGINLMLFNPFATVEDVLFDIEKAMHYIKKGAEHQTSAYVFVNPRMEPYHGAPIMKAQDLVRKKMINHPGMLTHFDAPSSLKIIDEDARALFTQATAESEDFIKRLLANQKYRLHRVPFFIRGLALFHGVYAMAGKPEKEIQKIEHYVDQYLQGVI